MKKYLRILAMLILISSLISCNKSIVYHSDFVSESNNTLEYDTDEYLYDEIVFTVDKDKIDVKFEGKISVDDGKAKILITSNNGKILYEESFSNVNNQKINIKCENLTKESPYKLILDGTKSKKLKLKLESNDKINITH